MTGTHECPSDGCDTRVPDRYLFCLRCWGLCPPELRRDLYAKWWGGRGHGTSAHTVACWKAIQAVNTQLARIRVTGEQLTLGGTR